MVGQNFKNELEKAKRDFLESLIDELKVLKSSVQKLNGQKRSEVDVEELSNVVRKLHNIKSVSGTYGLNFIQSAARNILDHTSYIYDLNEDNHIEVSLACEIFDLLVNYINNSDDLSGEEASDKLSNIVTGKNTMKRVLIVEKDQRLIEHFRNILNEKEMTYSIVTSGAEAFNRLLEEKFDLLITDLHVGKLDGPSLIAANRVSNSINKDIPTLMLSISYFDLLPSVSVPDFFVTKNENLLTEFSKKLDSFISGSSVDKDTDKLDILCLDDDQNIHDLLKISFSSHNISYRQSLNGREFIQNFKNNKPQLVILDLILDSESGIDVIRRIKDEIINFDVPVIVLSSLEGELRSELLSEVPFIIGALSKPFTPKSMGSDVMRMYRESRRTFMK